MLSQTEADVLFDLYPVLGQLTAQERDTLRRESRSVRLPTGSVLFDMDSPCSLFLLLTEGTVRVVKPALSGREIVLYRLEPGDSCILTVSCLLGDSSYPARGVAETAIGGYVLPRPLFYALLSDSEAFRGYVFRYFAARIGELMQLVEEVAFGAVDQRLANLLVVQGPLIEATHQQIADELGTVREVVSRRLKLFEHQGLVRLQRGRVEVLDMKRLSRMTGSAA